MKTLLALLWFTIVSCGNSNSLKNKEAVMIKQKCLAATTESNYAQLNDVSNRSDETELLQMISDRKVYVLEPGDMCKVIKMDLTKLYLDTKHGRLWVANEFVE